MSKSAVVSRSTRVLAAITLACAGLDLVVLAGFHLIQPEIDPLTSATSEYVHGKAGAMSSVTSAAVGLGAVSLAVAVWRITVTVSARVGAGLLAVFGLAKLAQSFFPIDAGGATTTGLMHNLLGNLAFLVLPVAAILIDRHGCRATARRPPVAVAALPGTLGRAGGDSPGHPSCADRRAKAAMSVRYPDRHE